MFWIFEYGLTGKLAIIKFEQNLPIMWKCTDLNLKKSNQIKSIVFRPKLYGISIKNKIKTIVK